MGLASSTSCQLGKPCTSLLSTVFLLTLRHSVVRASLGAMSTVHDVDRFLSFLHDTFVARADSAYASSDGNDSVMSDQLEPRGTVSAEQHEFGPGDASCA